ncbi:hypothetical protein QR680_011560 [Steinernema hermaphroditum]|uniref:RING-type domain-containing protein n=1 Tax=Steinernema hermaphroditum TaxID=289476 RepID=A0AA39I1B9_9BILA|nr:hypothetical protein QR680_011560 [Steinernema hermaphroditum]
MVRQSRSLIRKRPGPSIRQRKRTRKVVQRHQMTVVKKRSPSRKEELRTDVNQDSAIGEERPDSSEPLAASQHQDAVQTLYKSLQEMESFKNQIESYRNSTKESLTCPICTDIFYRPLICTPCGHRFCSYCLFQYFRRPLDREQSHYDCPLCRRVTKAVVRDTLTSEMVESFLNTFSEFKPDQKTCEKRDSKDTLFKAGGYITGVKKNETQLMLAIYE